MQYLFCLPFRKIVLFSGFRQKGKQALYMCRIVALIFHFCPLVFPWLALCPVCMLPAGMMVKGQSEGWDEGFWEWTVTSWWLRLSGFLPVEPAVCPPVGQTSNTADPDLHSSGEMEEPEGQGVSLPFLKWFLTLFLIQLQGQCGD